MDANRLIDDCEIVHIDIMPGLCPNELSLHKRGVLDIAIVGTPTFPADQIDRVSLRLTREDGVGGTVSLRPKSMAG